jgi:hypothetical protein
MVRNMPPAYRQMIEDYFRRAATLPDALPGPRE